MPIQGGPSNHPTPSVAQLPIVTRTLTLPGAGSQATVDLFADNLPGLSAWFLHSGGVIAVTVQLQFAWGQNAGSVNWQPLVPAYALVINVPSLVNYRLGSRRYRAVLTSTGAGTVLYRLAAALT